MVCSGVLLAALAVDADLATARNHGLSYRDGKLTAVAAVAAGAAVAGVVAVLPADEEQGGEGMLPQPLASLPRRLLFVLAGVVPPLATMVVAYTRLLRRTQASAFATGGGGTSATSPVATLEASGGMSGLMPWSRRTSLENMSGSTLSFQARSAASLLLRGATSQVTGSHTGTHSGITVPPATAPPRSPLSSPPASSQPLPLPLTILGTVPVSAQSPLAHSRRASDQRHSPTTAANAFDCLDAGVAPLQAAAAARDGDATGVVTVASRASTPPTSASTTRVPPLTLSISAPPPQLSLSLPDPAPSPPPPVVAPASPVVVVVAAAGDTGPLRGVARHHHAGGGGVDASVTALHKRPRVMLPTVALRVVARVAAYTLHWVPLVAAAWASRAAAPGATLACVFLVPLASALSAAAVLLSTRRYRLATAAWLRAGCRWRGTPSRILPHTSPMPPSSPTGRGSSAGSTIFHAPSSTATPGTTAAVTPMVVAPSPISGTSTPAVGAASRITAMM